VTEFSAGITPRSEPAFIVAGGDRNLWFTQEGSGQVARITTAGAVTEFDVGGSSPDPDGITAGPDGNIWFSIRWQNAIGRITPDGHITKFSAGITSASMPTGITAGPDGNLWFTEMATARVARISPGPVTDGGPAAAGPVKPSPSRATCTSRRLITVHLRVAPDDRLISARVTANRHLRRARLVGSRGVRFTLRTYPGWSAAISAR